MRPITTRQREILEFIRSFIRTNKYPPTIREISDNFNISVKGAHDHVRALQKKQAIRCDRNRSRAIEILDEGDSDSTTDAIRRVPMLGSVAAGLPVLADENYDGAVDVPASFLRTGDYFALTVQGDSMVGAGIMDGDIAVISRTPVAENGEIVVAMVDEAVTIKRFYRESSRVQLKAENAAYAPIYTRDVRILGKLAHVIRNYE